jgi:formylglycine-generating enzyme required for sulfatase activity
MGTNYDLINNAQWQAIARDIESVSSNWSNGSSSGFNAINRGHSDTSPNASLSAASDSFPCYETGNTNCATNSHSDFTQKRTHTLSNGEVIWDIAGNVWEWVKDNNSSIQAPNDYIAIETGWDSTSPGWPMQSDKLNFGPAGDYTSKNAGEFGGLGYGFLDSNSGVVIRGGSFQDGTHSGAFAANLFLTNGPTYSGPELGFRCVATGGS